MNEMEEELNVSPAPPADDISDEDQLMAALSYPIPLVAIIILVAEDMKARPFQRYHAVQALVANAVVWVAILVLGTILGALSCFLSGICGFGALLLWLVTLYWAYEAYQGKYFEIPYLTQFARGQGWL